LLGLDHDTYWRRGYMNPKSMLKVTVKRKSAIHAIRIYYKATSV
jgi:hypothetical protein